VITKIDLAAAVEFDENAACASIAAVRPGMRIFQVSSKSGAGVGAFLDFLRAERTKSRATAVAEP